MFKQSTTPRLDTPMPEWTKGNEIAVGAARDVSRLTFFERETI